VLVGNQDVLRPRVGGEPFSTLLLADRASVGWQQAMETRYYLLPVHTSRTFLAPPTLSSTLYLVLLRLLHRAYAQAFREAEACAVDVPFTAEEAWVWGQLERTLDDLHPDAHAVRVKLSLAVRYSRASNKSKWEVHREMDRYLAKLGHVSAACRLTWVGGWIGCGCWDRWWLYFCVCAIVTVWVHELLFCSCSASCVCHVHAPCGDCLPRSSAW
jgi:hypothetical protein